MVTERQRRTRGRPTAAEGPLLRRSELLEHAASAFAEGYRATSVRRIARELGVSQAAVQYHVRTKDELLRAVIDELITPSVERVTASSAGVRPGDVAELRSLVRERMDALVVHGAVVSAVLEDASAGSVSRREHLLAALEPHRGQGLEALRALHSRGLTRPVTDAMWTLLMLVVVPSVGRSRAALAGLGPGEAPSLASVLDELADLLVLGLAAR